jgi:hypothetical protein
MNERSPREPSSHLLGTQPLIETGTTPEPTRLPSRQKIKLKTLSYFSTAEKSSFLSTFATQSTTTSPQKHHVLHTVFSKTTLKMPAKRQKPPSQPSQIFSAEDEQKITPK